MNHAEQQPGADVLEDRVLDDDLFPFFLEEAAEIIGQILEDLRGLDADPDQWKLMADIARGYHTMKSAARSVGLRRTGEICSALEVLGKQMVPRTDLPVPKVVRGLIIVSTGIQDLLALHTHRTPVAEQTYAALENHVRELAALVTP